MSHFTPLLFDEVLRLSATVNVLSKMYVQQEAERQGISYEAAQQKFDQQIKEQGEQEKETLIQRIQSITIT